MKRTYYAILELEESASPADIRRAYRRLVRRCHPDISGVASTPRFLEVQEASDVLSDPERRARYDAELHELRLSERPTTARLRLRSQAEPTRSRQVIAEQRHQPGPSVRYEVTLNGNEAARGAVIVVDCPFISQCPACAGGGSIFGMPCPFCGGDGLSSFALRPVAIQLPAGLKDKAVLTLRAGQAQVEIRVRVI